MYFDQVSIVINVPGLTQVLPAQDRLVGSVKVIFLSNCYRADKSTIFGVRGLLGQTINSGRGNHIEIFIVRP